MIKGDSTQLTRQVGKHLVVAKLGRLGILATLCLICVFVFLKTDGTDSFFILSIKDLQEYFFKNYKGGIRPRNPKSTHYAIWPKELTKYRDNWELITKHFNPLK